MNANMKTSTLPLATILMQLLLSAGCGDGGAQIAREAADRQAQQNETMAQLQGHVAAGAKQLAAEDAASRRAALALHRDIQTERAELTTGWNDLESQRQSIAHDRRTSSLLAALAQGGGAVLVAALALAFAALALFGLRRQDDAAEVAVELLLDEFAPKPTQQLPEMLPPTDADAAPCLLHPSPGPRLLP